MKILHWLSVAAIGLSLHSGQAKPVAPVAFDYFEYTGRDTAFETPLQPGQVRNPILAGFYPDPSICKVGSDYYLINSSFAYFPGIPIFHSRDLVNWRQIGHVISRPTQLNYDKLGVSRAIFAPAISHHHDNFYVVCTMVDGGGNFLVTAKDAAGPWSDPIWLGFDGIDPSLFFDDDGRAWIVNNGSPPDDKPLYQGHRAIWQQEFDVKSQKMIGPRAIIVNGGTDLTKKPAWIEGPHLYRRGEWYYLSCAEGGTGDDHSQVIFRSKAVTGPFEPWDKNPILTQRNLDASATGAVTSTGHADLIEGPDGNWWSVFLGCRPFAGNFYATGRETFLLPVTWTDDSWPVILPAGERVPAAIATPDGISLATMGLPASLAPRTLPLNGNFTWRDDFDGPTLSPLWVMLRQPHETWWSFTHAPGRLSLNPLPAKLAGQENPAFLARRLQHARFDVATSLNVPKDRRVSAGLVAFQAETYHYFLGVRRNGGGATISLERAAGKSPAIVATQKVGKASHVELRLKGDNDRLVFSYSTRPGEWKTLVPDADAKVLTTQEAGGFVGAVVGLHARTE